MAIVKFGWISFQFQLSWLAQWSITETFEKMSTELQDERPVCIEVESCYRGEYRKLRSSKDCKTSNDLTKCGNFLKIEVESCYGGEYRKLSSCKDSKTSNDCGNFLKVLQRLIELV